MATGASPNLIFQHPCVLGIRDTETVEQLRQKLVSAKGVAVIGNGAIALETVHSVCLLRWLECGFVWIDDIYCFS